MDREQSLSKEEKRKLLEKIIKEKVAGANARSGPEYPSQGFHFSEEFSFLEKRYLELEKQGLGSLYFLASEGINNNTLTVNQHQYINYCSYNYIGMSGDPIVSEAAKKAIDQYGTSVSASRLASGERPLHRELEEAITKLLGTEDTLVFVSGYGTNETVIGYLMGPEDLILYDSFIHASIQSGCKLSRATVRPFPHNNWEALDVMLQESRHQFRQVLIIIEGIYSMDGDIPNLPKFIEIKKRNNALLMVDEAHSMGILGEHGAGIGEYFQVERSDVEIWMGTLSKSFASCGGYISGNKSLITYLRLTVPGFVYSAGITPPNAAAALASIHLLEKEPERLVTLQCRARLFLELCKKQGFNTGYSKDSAIIPIIIGQSVPCARLSKSLFERGIFVLPIMYPTVPENSSRLRFFISSTHTEEQIYYTINTLAESMTEIKK